ncbi:MAG: phosphodiesterase YaeI [Acidobacteria bacterium]|nr:phosphodiesterase YaeI [Acidobacteriota bacterium]
MRRRDVLKWGGIVAAAAVADVVVVEPRWLSVEQKRVSIFGGKFRQPVRLVQLSDLHFSWCVGESVIRRAIGEAIEQKPDLVCLTGDFVTGASEVDMAVLADMLGELSKRVPTYAVKGNHDGGSWARNYMGERDETRVDEALKRAGVMLMQNRAELIRIQAGEFWLAGVGDLWSEEVNAYTTFRPIPPGERVVLMAHNPDTKDVLARESWDLMLSGHTHGSQNSIPGLRERFAPVRDKRFVDGLVRWEEAGRWIHVNRGVGNLMGVRVGCRPEVSVLELV